MKALTYNFYKLSKRLILPFLIYLLPTNVLAQKNEYISGNGKLTTKSMALAQFNAISVKGSWAVIIIECGKMPFFEVTTDSNIQRYIKADIIDNKLMITSTAWIEPSKITIKIQTPFITELETKGWVNINVQNVNTPELNLQGNVGNISLSGKCKKVTITSKSGVYDLANLYIDKLSVSMTGKGSVYYKGSANLSGDIQAIKNPDERLNDEKEIKAIKFKLKNNSDQKAVLFIQGPDDKFSYGLDIAAQNIRNEFLAIGTIIYVKRGYSNTTDQTTQMIRVEQSFAGKTVEIYPN